MLKAKAKALLKGTAIIRFDVDEDGEMHFAVKLLGGNHAGIKSIMHRFISDLGEMDEADLIAVAKEMRDSDSDPAY